MQQKKTRRGREYLNDFRRDVNGSYLYQGSYRRYTGSMPYAKLRGLLWALCGGALTALAAAGMVPAPGAMQQFYVLLPYAGALVAGISAVWALARMSRGGARLRSYVYEETVAKLPLRCLLTGVFAALAAVGECMDVFLNGGQNAIWYAVLFAALPLRPLRLLLPQGTPSGQRFIPKNPVPGAKSKRPCTITQNLAH